MSPSPPAPNPTAPSEFVQVYVAPSISSNSMASTSSPGQSTSSSRAGNWMAGSTVTTTSTVSPKHCEPAAANTSYCTVEFVKPLLSHMSVIDNPGPEEPGPDTSGPVVMFQSMSSPVLMPREMLVSAPEQIVEANGLAVITGSGNTTIWWISGSEAAQGTIASTRKENGSDDVLVNVQPSEGEAVPMLVPVTTSIPGIWPGATALLSASRTVHVMP